MDIYRSAHSATTENTNTYFSSIYGTFININHILGCEASFTKFRMIDIIKIALWPNAIDLEINNKKLNRKITYI